MGGLTNAKTAIIARYLVRSGHPYTPGNVDRILDWYKRSRLREAINSVTADGKFNRDFPIPVEMLFWKSDIITRDGAARLRRVFNMPHSNTRMPGRHGSLRRTVMADEAIVAFYKKYAARADAACVASTA